MVITRRIYIIYSSSVPRLNLTGVCMHINTSNIADGDPMWMWRYIQEQECMVTMTHAAKISGWKLNLLGCNQNWIKFIYKLIQKNKKYWSKQNMDMYTRMIMLDLNLVVFIYVWIFFFTLFNWDTKDFTHFCVSSVHLKAVQFAFALQISFQVHEMGFNFHWAFALGAVNWLSVVGLVGWMPNDITATFERWPDTCTSLSRWRCGHTFCGGHFQVHPSCLQHLHSCCFCFSSPLCL